MPSTFENPFTPKSALPKKRLFGGGEEIKKKELGVKATKRIKEIKEIKKPFKLTNKQREVLENFGKRWNRSDQLKSFYIGGEAIEKIDLHKVAEKQGIRVPEEKWDSYRQAAYEALKEGLLKGLAEKLDEIIQSKLKE